MSILTVKINHETDTMRVSFPANHQKHEQIKKWLTYLSAGYVVWLLRYGKDPHCSNCRDIACDNIGNGDDACPAFRWGEDW